MVWHSLVLPGAQIVTVVKSVLTVPPAATGPPSTVTASVFAPLPLPVPVPPLLPPPKLNTPPLELPPPQPVTSPTIPSSNPIRASCILIKAQPPLTQLGARYAAGQQARYVGAPAGRPLKAHYRHHQVRRVDRQHMMACAMGLRQSDITLEITAEKQFKVGDVRPAPGYGEHGTREGRILAHRHSRGAHDLMYFIALHGRNRECAAQRLMIARRRSVTRTERRLRRFQWRECAGDDEHTH